MSAMPGDSLEALYAEARELRAQQESISARLAKVEQKIAASSREQKIAASSREAKRPRITSPTNTAPQPKPYMLWPEAAAEVAARRAAGQILPIGAPGRVPRVYVDGCFDMMHSGHMNAVRQAKLLADEVGGVLVVGVHTDAEIMRTKGPPVMREDERMALVAAVKWVDELVLDTPYTPTVEFLDSLDIDFCVHGDDMSIAADGTDAYGPVKAAGRIRIVKRTEGVSTTDLVGRLLLLTRDHHAPPLDAPLCASSSQAVSASGAGAAPPPSPPVVASPGAAAYEQANISSSGVSQFLATTRRLTQFSSGRKAGRDERVVYVDGAFDLCHAAHVHALYAARRRGDYLLVGLHDDATVNARCGANHPLMSLHERALCVLALAPVDEVILGAPATVTADLLRTMNVALVVGNADPNYLDHPGAPGGGDGGGDRYAAARELGRYADAEQAHPLRLEEIVRRIVDNRAKYEQRNATREKKELKYVQEKAFVEEL